MKLFLIAVAMATAAPAVAQTAAPANPHASQAGHSAQQAQGQQAGHGAPAAQSGQADPHPGHAVADCCRRGANERMASRKAMASGNGRGCCAGQRAQGRAADPHAGHDMSGGAHAGHGPNRN
jgi:hypothetical protein